MNAIELNVSLQFRISFFPSGSLEGKFCNKITRLDEDSAIILSASGPPAPSRFPNAGEDIDIISSPSSPTPKIFRGEVPVICRFQDRPLLLYWRLYQYSLQEWYLLLGRGSRM